MKFDFKKINKHDGFIVQVLYLLFYYLERVSMFYWVRVIGQKIHDCYGGKDKTFVNTYISLKFG